MLSGSLQNLDTSIGSGNGLVSDKHQTTTLINNDQDLTDSITAY